jgi:DNA-directed RNA polymerase specialized sigma24 family protein
MAASDCDPGAIDVLALHEALQKLEAIDQRQAELVQLRYFGGLTISQASDVMGISSATLEREWRVARAWLASKIDLDQTDEEST